MTLFAALIVSILDLMTSQGNSFLLSFPVFIIIWNVWSGRGLCHPYNIESSLLAICSLHW